MKGRRVQGSASKGGRSLRATLNALYVAGLIHCVQAGNGSTKLENQRLILRRILK